MATYNSDSSDEEQGFTTTDVLLGYASNEPTDDEISQLGGLPVRPEERRCETCLTVYKTWIQNLPPSAKFARCLICNNLMPLLLQLHANLPESFPGHDRRLHVFGCRRKLCRRKQGSIRAIRSTRVDPTQALAPNDGAEPKVEPKAEPAKQSLLGNDLFGGSKPTADAQNKNPFASSSGASQATAPSPFSLSSTSELAAKPPQRPESDLAQTFAEKARISSTPPAPPAQDHPEPWPEDSSATQPYQRCFLDADYEALGEDPAPPATQRSPLMELDDAAGEGSSLANLADDAFESAIDKTFQRFADRLYHNPEQVLRYEFGGRPLLYSKTDAVGKILAPHQQEAPKGAKVSVTRANTSRSGIPNCTNCGATRVFECQLTPHAIVELEAEDEVVDGMEWGTIIVGVCSVDCEAKGVEKGKVGYLAEWAGVQWEDSKK